MLRKDLGLLILILVVGAVVALINPRFLSPVNLANTANLIGLFGIFSLGEGLVIITAGIDLSIGSVFALLGVIFVDLLVTYELPWPLAVVIILVAGTLVGLINGFLITRMRLQPFVVTLCGLLLYRGIARYYTNDGTAGRSIVDGPGYRNVDLGVFRDIRLAGRAVFQIRVETTNVFNIVNLQNPGTAQNALATFGKIRLARDMRRIQLGARLSF